MSKQSDLVTVARDAGASGYVNAAGDTMTGPLVMDTAYQNGLRVLRDYNVQNGPAAQAIQFGAKLGSTPVYPVEMLGVVDTDGTAFGFEVRQDTNLHLKIDSAGRVTMPYQPSWRVTLGSTQSVTNTGYQRINWDSDSQGSGFATSVTFATGRITVPVSGKYYVTLLLRSEITAFGTTDVNIRLNGTEVNRWYQNNNSVSNYQHYGPICAVINMAANDYLETWISPSTSGDLSAGNNTVCFFMGHLIG